MWRIITEDDLRSAINKSEDSAIREAMLGGDQEDPFVTVVRQIVGLFRGAIRSGQGNRLDTDEATLPESAIYHAVSMIRFRLLSRFAAELIDDDRRAEKKDATDWLKAVRDGAERIEPPADATEETNESRLDVVSQRERQATRKSLNGLY